MENHIVLKDAGIICDNEKCEWEDKTVTFEQMGDWINRPCPNCGENLLTLEDYTNVKLLIDSVAFMNSLSIEELTEINELIDTDTAKKSDFYKDAKGLENLGNSDRIIVKLDTHKGIKAKEIYKSKNQ